MLNKKSQPAKSESPISLRRGISAKRYIPETSPAGSQGIWGRKAKQNVDETEIRQKIEKKAYELFEKRGYAHGNDFQDWVEAEQIVTKGLAGK
ncbi:MAG: DUF2934 domain-containing protein [Candidatus Omnitrophica bacterium]|nr:DUF2934 domain-containing protein [Candidatus Omnitrophota bacterium]